MQKIDPVYTYKVWYKLNPEYDGTFQVDKIGSGGLHCTVTPQMGGLAGAKEQAARARAWFNEEKIAVEKSNAQGKKFVEVKTTFHNNVIVWIEKYKDGYPVEETIECPPVPAPVKPSPEMTNLQLLARLEELERRLQEKENPSKKGKKTPAREEEEELAGV